MTASPHGAGSAATIVVNTLADIILPIPGLISLRKAILTANFQAGDDVITFLPGLTGTIQLNGALPILNSNIDIQGPGANLLTVRRDTGGDVGKGALRATPG